MSSGDDERGPRRRIDAIRALMEYETAGDPMTGLKWTRKTTQRVAEQLSASGIAVGATPVGRILEALGFSLRAGSLPGGSRRVLQ